MYDETKKKAIMKWRHTHQTNYNDYMREIFYIKHCEKIKQNRKDKYYFSAKKNVKD